jgi:hypothetical protein
MPFIPTDFNFPWKEDKVRIAFKGGRTINPLQVEYFKELISALRSMYTEISNAFNLDGHRVHGTAVIPQGTNFVNVTHGLLKTPALADVRITPINISSNAVQWAVTAVTSTTFTITLSGDPGLTGALFSWEVHILG